MMAKYLGATALVIGSLLSAPVFATPSTYSFYFRNGDGSLNSTIYGDVVISGFITTESPVGPPTSATPASSMIESISGMVSGGNPLYVTPGQIGPMSGWADADETLYDYGPSGPNNDYSFGGISFNIGTTIYNLYDWNGGTYLLSSLYDPVGYPQNGTSASAAVFDAFVEPVPEPLTLSLFGVGLVGAAAMRRRRKKAA
jgi:hypothetical protein